MRMQYQTSTAVPAGRLARLYLAGSAGSVIVRRSEGYPLCILMPSVWVPTVDRPPLRRVHRARGGYLGGRGWLYVQSCIGPATSCIVWYFQWTDMIIAVLAHRIGSSLGDQL